MFCAAGAMALSLFFLFALLYSAHVTCYMSFVTSSVIFGAPLLTPRDANLC